ncbi:MAG: ATP-binding protein [Pseudonocardiales bacterium]
MSRQTVERRLRPALTEALAASPVVAITGVRTAGKSTLVREIVATGGGTFVDLDDPAVRRLAADDPTAFVRDLPEPVVIDEFQRVPDLLAAIKAELNRDRRPGRFLLAGSARHQVIPELADFRSGGVELLTLWPFAVAELMPDAVSVVDRLFDGSVPGRRRAAGMPRRELVEIVLRGGYPIAVGLAPEPRSRWFANLAALVIERIGDDVTPVRRADVLGRFLRLSAARTGQLLNAAELGRDAGLGRDQAGAYLRLLELVYLVVALPAWSVNLTLTSRMTKRPKLHLVDSGLAAHLQGITAEQFSPVDPAAASRFGALLETFVVTEVLKQAGWASEVVSAYHYRTTDGVEVDLVLEAADGRVVAIEVKAGSQLTASALRGLTQLRDRLGTRFVAGLLVTLGIQTQRVGDRLSVAPVDILWRP